jgi:outer membrane protein
MPFRLAHVRSAPRGSRARSALAVVLLSASLAAVATADVRIGYIDSARIFQEYKNAQEAQQRFDRQVQGWRDEAAEKEKTVTTLRAEVRDLAPILSALKRQEKEEALQRAVSDYERFVQEIWGPQGKATVENERATGAVVNEIRAVVEKIAVSKNLNLVLDSAGGFIIYADKNLDLTSDVITELNTRNISTTPK